MENKELYVEERRYKIYEYIEKNARCSVSELAILFRTTPVTIRSDLRALESESKIIRTHGGAMTRSKIEQEDYVHERKNDDVKNKIALKALSFINNGDTLAIDTGSTANAFATALVHSKIENLKIITSDFSILKLLEKREDFEIIAIGGKVRHNFHFSYGDLALQTLDLFRVDKTILTTSAVDFNQGLTTPNIETANLKSKMISIAKEVILLTDISKFDKICFSKVCDLNDIDRLVINEGLTKDVLTKLEATVKNINIIK